VGSCLVVREAEDITMHQLPAALLHLVRCKPSGVSARQQKHVPSQIHVFFSYVERERGRERERERERERRKKFASRAAAQVPSHRKHMNGLTSLGLDRALRRHERIA